MASMNHEIANFPRAVKKARAYNKDHLAMKRQAQERDEKSPAQRMPTEPTLNQYIAHAKKFGIWCQETYQCRHWEDCKPYIQDYADCLKDKGLSAATIHTYMAGICFVWEVPLSEIKKPLRHAADSSRSRGQKKSDTRADRQRSPATEYLFDFAQCVGIRRDEYQGLRGTDFCQDESGYPCVYVRKGKGGKRQLQRLRDEDVSFVASYFDGSDNYVFSREQIRNKLDLHALRAQQAQRLYGYYCRRLEEEPGYRRQLMEEIRRRWLAGNGRKWSAELVEGSIWLRAKNRRIAMQHGLPLAYDRLAVMAVSVFHLSHWRTDVAISHYLLACTGD